MNAPQPPAGTVVARAPIGHFAPSLTNRTHTAEHIADLGENIKLYDVVQPITARPWPAARGPAPDGVLYEIVIGEGRWRGARHAGLADIPFFWREIGDEQALELQLIENLKRKDLTAIEEAKGYRHLMNDYGHTAESIAVKIGKSKGYVYAKLKLLELCPAALKFFAEGKLDAITALLVARIPVPELQVAAAKKIASGTYYSDSEPMSYRQASDMVQREFMLRLDQANFSRADDELVASAGSCLACPKRTGNADDLFADVKSADMCIDPPCYEAKAAAHVKRQKEAAKKEGVKVIDGAEAKKVKPYSHSDLVGGLVSLDKEVYVGGKYQTLRKALDSDAKAEAIIIDPHHKGKVIEAMAKSTIQEKLEAKGLADKVEGLTRGGKSTKEKEAERKRKQEASFRQRVFEQVRSKLTVDFSAADADLQLNEYRLVAEALFYRTGFDNQKRLARLWVGPTHEKQDDHALIHELKQRIPAMERGDLCRLLIECAIVGDVTVPSYADRDAEKLLAMAQSLEIDTAAIKSAVIAEMRVKTKPKPAARGGAKAASTPSPAAQAQVKGTKPAAPETPEKPKTPAAKKAKAKTDPAPASPANEPPAAAKPSKPELAEGLIYCHPSNPTLTWTGRGKEPAWVKELFKRGGGLEVREIAKKPAAAKSAATAWPFPPPADDTQTMTLPGVEESKEAAEAAA
jgi:ParB/RepB/Spo0J family partition protein